MTKLNGKNGPGNQVDETRIDLLGQLMDIVTYYIMTYFNVRSILLWRVTPSTTNIF